MHVWIRVCTGYNTGFIVTSHMGDYKEHVRKQDNSLFFWTQTLFLHRQTDAEGGHRGIPDEQTHKRSSSDTAGLKSLSVLIHNICGSTVLPVKERELMKTWYIFLQFDFLSQSSDVLFHSSDFSSHTLKKKTPNYFNLIIMSFI